LQFSVLQKWGCELDNAWWDEGNTIPIHGHLCQLAGYLQHLLIPNICGDVHQSRKRRCWLIFGTIQSGESLVDEGGFVLQFWPFEKVNKF
jgi:hypothetical protein